MNDPAPGPDDDLRTVTSNRPAPAPDACSGSAPVVLDVTALPVPFAHYTLVRRLGAGGMGTVYLARDLKLARDVALKMLPADATDREREMFVREARAAAALDHPNLCPVYEVGEAHGRSYLAMKYVDGKTLAQHYAGQTPLAPREAAEMVRAVARAIGAAHAVGVVHRDLKPANVMVDGLGEPVVVDFGLALRRAAADPRVSQMPVACGTPAYMAPEQANDPTNVGPTADVWALGVILFELLVGRRPFEGTTTFDVLCQSATEPAPRPRALNPRVDPALEAIVLKCLEKSPGARYATATALATALGGYLASPPVPVPRKRLRVAALVVAAVALAGVAVYLIATRGAPVAKTDPGAPPAPKIEENTNPPPNPVKPLPPTVVLAPHEGTTFRADECEYLTDATRAGAAKWLAAHKTAAHSVMWLDAYQAGDEPRFAALAATGGPRAESLELLDLLEAQARVGQINAVVDRKKYPTLVAVSDFTDAGVARCAMLWNTESRKTLSFSSKPPTKDIQPELTRLANEGYVVRLLRPSAQAGTVRWTYAADRDAVVTSRCLADAEEAAVGRFIADNLAPGLRLGAIAACDHGGRVAFGVTMYSDKDARGSEYALGLTRTELEARAGKLAADGFTPVSLTGYATKTGTRFCAAWVKYAPKQDAPKVSVTLEPKDGQVVAVAGYEYLLDATKDGLRLWVKAQEGRRAVVWVDAYMIGDAPRFAAVAALGPASPEQLDWVVHTDKNAAQIHSSTGRERMIDVRKYALVAQSYYTEDRTRFGVLFWRRGGPTSVAFDNSENVASQTRRFLSTDMAVRQIRPVVARDSIGSPIIWYWHGERENGVNGEVKVLATAEEMRKYLTTCRKLGEKRPGCVAAVDRNGAVSFAATAFADPSAADFDLDLDLSAADLPKRAAALAVAGFGPAALTAYERDAGARFCVVWIKPKEPAKKP